MPDSSTSLAVERAQRRLREVLVELRSIASQHLDAKTYYRIWLTQLTQAMGAESSCFFSIDAGGGWELVHFVRSQGSRPTPSQRQLDKFQDVRRSGAPVIDASEGTIYFPLLAAGRIRGLAQFIFAHHDDEVLQSGLKFLSDASQSVEYFHLLADRNETIASDQHICEERKLAAVLHADLSLSRAVHALVSEGRQFIGCDRLTVLVRHGRRYVVQAISGQESVNRRATTVRALEDLSSRSALTGEWPVFPRASRDYDERLTQLLEAYVDESHVQRMLMVPLRMPPATTVESPAMQLGGEVLGAVVVEYFGANSVATDESERIGAVTHHGAAAVHHCLEHESIPFLSIWQTLGHWRKACLEPGTRRRTWTIIVAAVAAVIALATIPAEYTAFCRGTLNPKESRRVFAPLDGIVEEVAVRHGQHVAQGQLLVRLRNTDLDIAEAGVAGRRTSAAEQMTAVERTLFDEAKRLTAEERSRLSGERSQLREQLTSLDRQLQLYAEKRRQLAVVSPIAGEVTTWNAHDLLENRPIRQGQQLLTVADVDGPWELQLRVPDHHSGRVVAAAHASSSPLRVTFSPAVDPGRIRDGSVLEIQNSAELHGEDGNTVLVRVAIDAGELPQRRPGSEAAAHIHCGRRAVGYVWLSDAFDFIRSRILFRWF